MMYEHLFFPSQLARSSKKMVSKLTTNNQQQIYMISSINHHISILHLRVHNRYVDVLSEGESEIPRDTDSTGQPWHVLKLQRTKWYDLLDAKDRVEAFQGVWRVYHYLLRN